MSLHELQRHRGEGLVDLEQVDVGRSSAGLGQRLARRRRRAGQHDRRVGAGERAQRRCARAASGPAPCAVFSVPISTAAAPSTMPEELPAWCTWWMRSTCGYLLQRHGVEAHRAHRGEGGLERGQAFQRGVGLMNSSWSRIGDAVEVLHRHDGVVEAARRRARPRRAAATRSAKASTSSRVKPSSVAIRSAPMPCGTKPVSMAGLRVHGPGAAVGAHRHAAHATRRRRRRPGPPSRARPSARRGSPPPGPRRRSG